MEFLAEFAIITLFTLLFPDAFTNYHWIFAPNFWSFPFELLQGCGVWPIDIENFQFFCFCFVSYQLQTPEYPFEGLPLILKNTTIFFPAFFFDFIYITTFSSFLKTCSNLPCGWWNVITEDRKVLFQDKKEKKKKKRTLKIGTNSYLCAQIFKCRSYLVNWLLMIRLICDCTRRTLKRVHTFAQHKDIYKFVVNLL